MTELSVRSATVEDVPAIRDLATASWHAAYDGSLGSETVDTVLAKWYDVDTLEAQVSDPSTVFLLAVRDGAPVGYANAGPATDRSDVSLLWRLYVHPDCWGEGIGSRLLDAVEDELGDERDVLELTVLATNDRGRRFYEARGFELVDRKPTTLADTAVVECVYRKPLGRRQG